MYKLKEETIQNIENQIERMLGIKYDDFIQLDDAEQRRLITEYHKKKGTKKSDYVIELIGSGEHSFPVRVKRWQRIMVGSGENSIFVRAGITPEEARRELDDRIDDALYSKPVAFVKKIGRRLKGR